MFLFLITIVFVHSGHEYRPDQGLLHEPTGRNSGQ